MFLQADDASSRTANVREVLAQECLKFDGDLKNLEDMESLVDAQMHVLRRLFRVPTEVGEAGWIRVSKQLLKLFRKGELGRFTLDDVPVANQNVQKFDYR